MYKKLLASLFFLTFWGLSFSQTESDSITSVIFDDTDDLIETEIIDEDVELPEINYSTNPPTYEIAGITTSGAPNYEDFVLIGVSGLEVGQKIKVPGDEITSAIKRYWKQGMFSDVKITATKIEGSKIWLNIGLTQRPRVSKVALIGLKKSEKEDIQSKIPITKGKQLTPNIISRTKDIIKKHFAEKGFMHTEVTIVQKVEADGSFAMVDIIVDKKAKIKVGKLEIEGNEALTFGKINRAMKKTNEKGKIMNFFKTKKYIKDNYEADKIALIDKYNELGYRDAVIVSDSVSDIDEKSVKVHIIVDEGKKYFFRNITWLGNTLYPSEGLAQMLRINKGDVYNTKKLNDRLTMDEDAVANLYLDDGYLFFNIEPVEKNIIVDSIDVEMRIFEGPQATINEVGIYGNTRVYENVVRRELRTKPGQLFSKTNLQRTMREIAQMGHFDPEALSNGMEVLPNMENGTVDINYHLETKSSDQFEMSIGWGSTGVIGSVGLKFTNFSIQNLFKPSSYRIVPQGDGQTLSLRAQTNASYYQSYGISFTEPWLGGKRPTSLTISANYSIQTGVSDRYYNSGAYSGSYYYSQVYGNDYYNSSSVEYDDEKFIKTLGLAAGIGTRLSWPDDYFTLYGEIAYQRYNLQNWSQYLMMGDGKSNNLSLNITLGRNSINNPYYATNGSSFSASLQITPPYSLFDNIDYSDSKLSDQDRYRWIEYHKWKVKARTFTPLTRNEKLVFMARADFGFLGYYNKNKRSPFETFYMGGDGMTTNSYSSYAIETVGMRGYANGSLTPIQSSQGTQVGNLYTKLSFELRYPLVTGMTTVYALAFLDAGNCWYDFKDFNPFQLKRSAGVGLRVILPMIGLIGVDWGYGFDKINGSYDYSKAQFHFVLGQEF